MDGRDGESLQLDLAFVVVYKNMLLSLLLFLLLAYAGP
jgi:hypothetical protein